VTLEQGAECRLHRVEAAVGQVPLRLEPGGPVGGELLLRTHGHQRSPHGVTPSRVDPPVRTATMAGMREQAVVKAPMFADPRPFRARAGVAAKAGTTARAACAVKRADRATKATETYAICIYCGMGGCWLPEPRAGDGFPRGVAIAVNRRLAPVVPSTFPAGEEDMPGPFRRLIRTIEGDMLNQHHNMPAPLSDFLKIGDCVLDLPRREITTPQRSLPLRITLKAQQVLMVLVAHQGKVVSREALIEWVWPDTLPTDDVLTQAIAQLRKAFCEDRDAPRYLETIAKGGYRLLAGVSWLDSPDMDATVSDLSIVPAQAIATEIIVAPVAATVAPAPRRHGVLPMVVVALVVVAVAAGLVALSMRRTAETPMATQGKLAAAAPPAGATTLDYQRITSLPGDEAWPSVSPDGGQVVYSAYSSTSESATLMVQATAPVPARELTPVVKGTSDVMAAWSPDGRQIVFTRYEGADKCSLMLMPSSGGEARAIGRCLGDLMPNYSWHPDAKHLIATGVITPHVNPGVFQVLDLATGNWQPLPYEKGERDVDMSPVYSPDGKWIAFQRNISLSDLWRMPAAGGKPQRLTRLKVNIYGLAWTPDSRSIVFSGYRDDGTALLRLDIDNGRVSDLGMSESDVSYPSIGRNASSLAFMLTKSHSGIYYIPLEALDAKTPVAKPQAVFSSSGKDLLPAISPDGRQIAFISDRSARPGLWWSELERPGSLRWIEGIIPIARFAPVWSGDSQRLLMAGRTDNDPGIYEITPATAQVRRLPIPADNPIRAEYLPDPSRLLVVADQGGGRLGLMLYDRSASPWRVLASIEDVVFAKVDTTRKRILFTRPARPGLWQADFNLIGARIIAKRPAPGAPSSRRLVIGREGIWLAAADEQCGLRWTALEVAGQPSRCLLAEGLGVTSFSYDDLHGRLYFSSEKEENSDIGWMPLVASARP
jgi:Tol biopolymer transport system component/DNA-binding winged helix-turn-helix (wHTH) protein